MTNIIQVENELDAAQAELEAYEAKRNKMAAAFRIIVAENAYKLFGNVSVKEMKNMEGCFQDAIDDALYDSVSQLKNRIEELESDAGGYYGSQMRSDYYGSVI